MTLGAGTLGTGTLGGGTAAAESPITGGLLLLIGGVDRSGLLRDRSLSVSQSIGVRSTADFELVDETDMLEVLIGQEVELWSDNVQIFGGSVDDVRDLYPAMDADTPDHLIEVGCVDHHAIADRHLVAAAFETPGQTAADIVRTLLADYLAQDGVTEGTVEASFELGKVLFDYQTINQALDDLARLVGFTWRIDFQKKLHFHSFSGAPGASWNLTDSSRTFARLIRSRGRESYRNIQLLRAGLDVTEAERVETFQGDSETQTFLTALPVAKVPTVKVNAVTKTVGIQGVDDDDAFDFYWNKGSDKILQQRDAAELTSSDTLEVTYTGFLRIIVRAQNEGEIAARAAVEGGSGIYEAVEDDEKLDNEKLTNAGNVSQLAIQKAQGLLREFARIPVVADIRTFKAGIVAGTRQQISLAREKLDGDYMVKSVRVADLGGGQLSYDYSIVDGNQVESPFKFFQRLAERGRRFVIRENEIVIVFREAVAEVELTDSLTGDESDTLADWKTDPYTVAQVELALTGAHYIVDGKRYSHGARVAGPGEPTFIS